MDYYDRVAKLKQTGACGIYSAAPGGEDILRATMHITGGRRLLLSNLLIHTDAAPSLKMQVGVRTENSPVWLVNVVFAGFLTAAVHSVDTNVYMISAQPSLFSVHKYHPHMNLHLGSLHISRIVGGSFGVLVRLIPDL